jgi:DNA-binding transcriptional regulator YiaG
MATNENIKSHLIESYPKTTDSQLAGGAEDSRLVELISRWKEGKSTTVNDIAREFLSSMRVKRIIRHIAHAHRLPLSVDEVTQVVAARFFMPELLNSIYDESNVYSLIYRVALNSIKQMSDEERRWNDKHASIETDEGSDYEFVSSPNFTEDIIWSIDRERAEKELARRLKNNPIEPTKKRVTQTINPFGMLQEAIETEAANQNASAKKLADEIEAKPKVIPVDAMELRSIRETLGYKVKDFARLLNISRDKLSAALYGRMSPIDDDLMMAARSLLSQSSGALKDRENRFSRIENMDQMVKIWLEEINQPDNRHGEEFLAAVLNVYHSTIFRWRKDVYRPSLMDLEKYDDMIQVAKRYAAQKLAGETASQGANS